MAVLHNSVPSSMFPSDRSRANGNTLGANRSISLPPATMHTIVLLHLDREFRILARSFPAHHRAHLALVCHSGC